MRHLRHRLLETPPYWLNIEIVLINCIRNNGEVFRSKALKQRITMTSDCTVLFVAQIRCNKNSISIYIIVFELC